MAARFLPPLAEVWEGVSGAVLVAAAAERQVVAGVSEHARTALRALRRASW